MLILFDHFTIGFHEFCPHNFKGALHSKNELLGMDLAGHLFDESMTSIFWIF
jgi:hypothetical protein